MKHAARNDHKSNIILFILCMRRSFLHEILLEMFYFVPTILFHKSKWIYFSKIFSCFALKVLNTSTSVLHYEYVPGAPLKYGYCCFILGTQTSIRAWRISSLCCSRDRIKAACWTKGKATSTLESRSVILKYGMRFVLWETDFFKKRVLFLFILLQGFADFFLEPAEREKKKNIIN